MHYAHLQLGGIFSEGEFSTKKYLVNTPAISRNISLIVIIMNQRKILDNREEQRKMRLQISTCRNLIKRSKKTYNKT